MSKSFFEYNIDYSLSYDVPIEVLKQYMILPIKQTSLHILVATSNIDQNLDPIINIFHKPIKFLEVTLNELEYEYRYLKSKQKLFQFASSAIENDISKSENIFIINFLDIILDIAISNNISDIHFESLKDTLVVRLRFDGVLNKFFKFDKKLYSMLSSVIKFLAHLDISQKRLPLNGHFSKDVNNITYDFRISTMPTIYGESIVLRILDNKNIQKKLDSVGFDSEHLDTIYSSLNLTQGLILVTGPTGSGKTTTLYSMLNYLNKDSKKIITIEDPVEYKMDGIMQVNLNPLIDLDYHTVLKNILRQDPDILLIGEIRDSLSAKIAIRAALTGHLVIATLHTNNALETISRLKDLEVDPYLIATTLKLVIAQRLVRNLCNNCKKYNETTKYYDFIGCAKCNLTGYLNRSVVAEILQINKKLAASITKEENIGLNHFQTLQDSAKILLENGIISYDEYLSKVGDEI